MSRRKIGQEELMFKARGATSQSSLDELARLIDWTPLARELDGIHSASKGEPAWPPLASFKALLIAVWYDLSDVKLAEALDDRASFRRFCGFHRVISRLSAQPLCDFVKNSSREV